MATSTENLNLKITRNCRACRKGTHLVQDNSGSYWMHDTAADEYACWVEHRDMYEDGTL